MNTIIQKMCITFLVLTITLTTYGKDKPQWVKLLHENKYYFKTIEKVEKYWAHHYKPMELEEDKPQQIKDPRRWITKIFQSQETAKSNSNDLQIDYKYFKRWKFEMEPFVKNDGTIMTEDERIAAWEQANNHK